MLIQGDGDHFRRGLNSKSNTSQEENIFDRKMGNKRMQRQVRIKHLKRLWFCMHRVSKNNFKSQYKHIIDNFNSELQVLWLLFNKVANFGCASFGFL